MIPTAYGAFERDGREFVMRKLRLDRPWMNVLSNGRRCDDASHLGGGYTFLDNPTVGRIAVELDGVPLVDNLVPPAGDGRTQTVTVTISK